MKDDAYISEVRDRMSRGGYDTNIGAPPPGATLLGYRADFRWTWFATKLHLFVAVKQLEVATRTDIEEFTDRTLVAGIRAKGRIRGLQSGVGAIAVLVADHIDTGATQFAETELIRKFAAFAWPVTVDLSDGQRVTHIDDPKFGFVYTGWMRQQIDAVIPLPDPASSTG